MDLEQAREAARLCILQGLACLNQALGSLDRVERILQSQTRKRNGRDGKEVAASRGINFIDVAEMFPVPPKAQTQGRTEVLPRHLAQKAEARQVDGRHENYGARTRVRLGRRRPWPDRPQNHPGGLDGSLKRADRHIDRYQIHWLDRYLPLSATRFMTRINNEQRPRGYVAGRRSRGNRCHPPALPQSGNLNA